MLKMRDVISRGEVKRDSGESEGENSPQLRAIPLKLEIALAVVHVPESVLGFPSRYNNLLFSLSPAAQFFCHIKDAVKVSKPHMCQVFTQGKLTESSIFFSAAASLLQLTLIQTWEVPSANRFSVFSEY